MTDTPTEPTDPTEPEPDPEPPEPDAFLWVTSRQADGSPATLLVLDPQDVIPVVPGGAR